jgi:[ribosomal protein S5]-alanine N-acetyltransferase
VSTTRSASGSSVALATKRLAIHAIGATHATPLCEYHRRNEAHLARWEPERSPDFYTLGYWTPYVAAVMGEAHVGAGYRFVATRPGERYIVACVNLTGVVRGVFQAATLGYSVDEAHQGQGYGTEAVGAVTQWAFDLLGLHRIEASYQPANERSGRLLRALGFTVEGYARDYLFIDGAWRDHVLTSLVRPKANVR